MIGKIYTAAFKYYDNKNHKMAFKSRPVLIIGKADSSDYVVLPISRVTKKENLDVHFDYRLEPSKYSQSTLCLSAVSYVRAHKQTVISGVELVKEIIDFKKEFPKVYNEIIDLVEEFQKRLMERARKP